MRRHVVGLLALILALAACGGPAPTGSTAPPPGTDALVGPVGSPASNDAAAPTATTSTMDGSSSTGDGAADHDPSALLAGWPAAWGSPPVLPTADPFAATGVSDALPGPSLQDPAAIGFALYDPAQMDVGFVSLLARMGIGVDGDDGRVILPGTGDLRLPEGVVRSLIAQGRGDAANLDDQGQTRSTFRDLLPIVGPMVPGWDVGRLAAAYDHAYAAHPDDLLPAVLLGQPIEPSTPLNRLQLWALLVDGFMPPPVAVGAPGAQLAAGGSSFGTANPALPDDPEMAQADVIAMGLDGLIPVTLTPSQASVHEGHRQSGPTVTFTVAVGAARPPSFLPFRPRSTPNLSTTVTWLTGDPAFTSRHGSFSPGLGDAPIQGSSAQLAYRVRREPANGHGPILARTTVIAAEIPVGPLVAGAFDVPAEFQGALPYLPHQATSSLRIAWHGQPGIWLDLKNEFDLTLGSGGMLSPVLTMGLPLAGSATWSGTDRVAGFLEDLGDGTFRGTLAATVEDGAFHGTYAGTACALVYSGKQWLDIIGVEQPDGLVLDLTFVPMTDPEIEFDEASCPTENWLVRPAPDLSWWPDELGDPPRQPRLPEYLPFANSRWTNPSVGYSIRAATHFLPEISYVDDEDDDAAEEAGFGTSVWSIDEQLEEAVP